MSASMAIRLTCDCCGERVDVFQRSVEKARATMAATGWKSKGKSDVCGFCGQVQRGRDILSGSALAELTR